VQQLAQQATWNGEDDPGEWVALRRSFRDGHTERWWAFEPKGWPFEAGRRRRLVVATTDPATLPDLTTFYLFTNLASPDGERDAGDRELRAADLAEVTRLYALRSWIEQSYKQVKNALGWAHYQVRKDLSIRRHWQLVCCAFSFCWWACTDRGEMSPPPVVVLEDFEHPSAATAGTVGGEKEDRHPATTPVVAPGAAEGALVAGALRNAVAILEGILRDAPAPRATSAA
jgi:hypothetical protein